MKVMHNHRGVISHLEARLSSDKSFRDFSSNIWTENISDDTEYPEPKNDVRKGRTSVFAVSLLKLDSGLFTIY